MFMCINFFFLLRVHKHMDVCVWVF